MIQLYSTEARKKVTLETRIPNAVSMYVCGPTVYDSCHIGHARPAVVFDTIRRYLEYAGYHVTFISNITDIDDKIINRANELGVSIHALTSRYQDEYEADMTRLGVRAPTIRPKATEHIAEMIELIQDLMDKGIAYATDRGVWFDVTKFKGYGRLSGRVADDENTEHRVEDDSEKKNPQDWALWKFVKPGEPAWPSPWGEGRPGWHIECSAMGGKYADFELDIHGGGADLTFPHHENEIAQSEACSGKHFAKYWLHNGFITVGKDTDDDGDGEKMGKSKGNAFWLRDAFKKASPAALRLWILGTHYRAPIMYKAEFLDSASTQLTRIYNSLEAIEAALDTPVRAKDSADTQRIKGDFDAAMNDDFNTPKALAALHDLVGSINLAINDKADPASLQASKDLLMTILGILGLPLARPESGGADELSDELMTLIIALRKQARADKNFAMSDQIRDEMTRLNIELRDTADGQSTWQRK